MRTVILILFISFASHTWANNVVTGSAGSRLLGEVVSEFDSPWAMSFINSDSLFVTTKYGTLKNLKPEGFMKVRLPNGEKYDGVWLNGQMQRAFSIRNRRNAEPVYHFH